MPAVKKTALFFLAFLRLTLPLFVFVNPYWGTIASLILDIVDYRLLVRLFRVKHSIYQVYDKLLDSYWYCLAFLFILVSASPLTQIIFGGLFAFRLVGEILFLYQRREKILFFFPNLFEPSFWVWILIPSLKPAPLIMIALIILPFKLLQEYIVHAKQLDIVDHLTAFVTHSPVKQRALD